MKVRWCILFVIIVLIGIASQKQVCLPNQEIVFHFTNEDVAPAETQKAVEIVKKQLQLIGVDNIQVQEQEGGSLKITYYSDKDAASIKKLLSKEKDIEFGYASSNQDKKHSRTPSKEKPKSYNLDVFEIQKQDTGLGFGGKYAIENKLDKNRFFNPNPLIYLNRTDEKETDGIKQKTYNFPKILQ